MAGIKMAGNQDAQKNIKYTIFSWFCRNRFLILLVTSTLSGYVLGISLQSLTFSSQTLQLISFPGKLVLRAFLMITVPILFCSLVLGVSSLQKGSDSRIVSFTIGFFFFLSTVSAIMGATAAHLIHPGQKITAQISSENERMSGSKGAILDSILDLLWNAIPSNIIESTFAKEYTHVEIVNMTMNSSDAAINSSVNYKKIIKQARGVNFTGLLMFSIIFGSALSSLGEKGRQLREVIQQLNDVVTAILGIFLNVLPVGMFFWMFREGLEARTDGLLFKHIGIFLATAFGCMAIHQFVMLPLLYLGIVRKNPVRFHLNLLPAMLTAFGTTSSAATLPVTMQCAEESNLLSTRVTRFVLPLGMVVHMNGSTLYLPLNAIFLSQLEGVEIGIAETVVMTITSIILIISAPATPSTGNPVFLLTAMAAGGVSNPQFISIHFSIDWLMTRFRTVMNIVGDSYVAAFVDKLCSQESKLQDIDCCAVEEYDLNTISSTQK